MALYIFTFLSFWLIMINKLNPPTKIQWSILNSHLIDIWYKLTKHRTPVRLYKHMKDDHFKTVDLNMGKWCCPFNILIILSNIYIMLLI